MIVMRRNATKVRRPPRDANASLWLDKYLDVQSKHPDTPRGTAVPGADARSRLIDQVCNDFDIPAGYSDAYNRWIAGHEAGRRLIAATTGRLVVGLGAKSVLEIGITLHRTWGIPFLPGSALKGLASRVAHLLLEGQGWKRPNDGTTADASHLGNPMHEHHAFLFGTTANEGAIVFHDAWWRPTTETAKKFPLDNDVMTVHHPDYYQTGNTAPSDFDSPIPIGFVSTQGTFDIFLSKSSPDVDDSWLAVATELLKKGLEEVGLGAKTNAGYGRFKVEVRDIANTQAATHPIVLRYLADTDSSTCSTAERIEWVRQNVRDADGCPAVVRQYIAKLLLQKDGKHKKKGAEVQALAAELGI